MSAEVRHLKKTEVRLDELHVQYILYIPYTRWWYGADMMALRTSPHVELMQIFKEHKFDWDIIKQTGYVAERRYRRTHLGRKGWTDDYIRERCKVRYRIFKQVKKEGFKHIKNKPVVVLDKPFWESRFGVVTPGISGPEIFDGAGRCSAAYVLGYERIPVMMAEDKVPGSKYWKKVQKEWETHQKQYKHIPEQGPMAHF